MNKKEKKIIVFYIETKSIRRTWEKFPSKSRNEITELLRSAGVLQAKGKGRLNFEAAEMKADESREFRYLTDKDLNFKEEIKSKLY